MNDEAVELTIDIAVKRAEKNTQKAVARVEKNTQKAVAQVEKNTLEAVGLVEKNMRKIVTRVEKNTQKAIKRLEQKAYEASVQAEKNVIEAAERAAGFYYEKTKDDIKVVLEAFVSVNERLDDMPTRTEFNELKDEVSTIRLVVTETNKDLKKTNSRVDNHEIRLTKLESAV